MIGTLLRIAWLKLRRDRVALLMSFVLPIAFFSVFAVIFGGLASGNGMPQVEVVVTDEDGGEASRRVVDAILAEESFRGPERGDERPIEVADRNEARSLVESGDADPKDSPKASGASQRLQPRSWCSRTPSRIPSLTKSYRAYCRVSR